MSAKRRGVSGLRMLWVCPGEMESSARPISGLASQRGHPFQGWGISKGPQPHIRTETRPGVFLTNDEMCKLQSRLLLASTPRLLHATSSFLPQHRAEWKCSGRNVDSTLPQRAYVAYSHPSCQAPHPVHFITCPHK